MRDKKIISFKEFYLREDHHTGYFPTFKAGYEGIKKHGPGIVKGGAKLGAKGIAGAAKGIAGGTKGLAKGAVGAARGTKRGFDKIARGLTNFGKSMAPEYKNQFSAGAKPAGNTLADSKTTQEAATTIAKWRDKHITKKDGTPAEAKTLKDFIVKGPTAQELLAAKQALIGSFPFSFASNEGILSAIEKIGFYQLPLNYLDTYQHKIAEVNLKQINYAFRRIKINKMVIVTVGHV